MSNSVTQKSEPPKASSFFAKTFAIHLSSVWKLTPEHQFLLELAMCLFDMGMVAVPLSSEKLRALLAELEFQSVEGSLLLEVENLVWPNAWMEIPDASFPEGNEDRLPPFVISSLDGANHLYPRKLLALECKIASLSAALFNPLQRPSLTLELQEEGLKKEQSRALKSSLLHRFTIMTGGPGTGKSFTATRIIKRHEVMQQEKGEYCHVIVAAPTGKAVNELQKKISEGNHSPSSIEYMTLHKLLQMTHSGKSNCKKPFLDASLILIDECSMIDMEIFSLLLMKLHPRTNLVLIGDPDQLPPIGTGDVFASLCQYAKSISYPGFVSLDESIRFENEQLREIAERCQKQDPSLAGHLQAHHLLTPLSENLRIGRWEVLNTLYRNWRAKTSLFEAKNPKEALAALQSAIVLCSLREGPWGVKSVGAFFLERALLERASFIPILFTRNDQRMELQNGLLGVLEVTPEIFSGKNNLPSLKKLPEGIIHYPTPEGTRTLPSNAISSFELAYTISVHKSQGSEFNHVHLLLSPGSEQFGKALLYTAATRAKHSLRFFSFKETLTKTLLFPSGNLSHLRDRLRIKTCLNQEALSDEKTPSLAPCSIDLSPSTLC